MKGLIILDWIGTLYGRNNGLFNYSKKVLEELRSRNYKLVLVSIAGKGEETRNREIEESGLKPYLDEIVVGDGKNEEIFMRAINNVNASTKNTFVVGDRMKREISVGNKIGCKTYWIKNGDYAHETPNEETGQPTQTIKSLKDILQIL